LFRPKIKVCHSLILEFSSEGIFLLCVMNHVC